MKAEMEYREQPDAQVPFNRTEAELLAQLCEKIGQMSTIAADCEAWLQSEIQEPSVEFIKAVRDYARKAMQE